MASTDDPTTLARRVLERSDPQQPFAYLAYTTRDLRALARAFLTILTAAGTDDPDRVVAMLEEREALITAASDALATLSLSPDPDKVQTAIDVLRRALSDQ